MNGCIHQRVRVKERETCKKRKEEKEGGERESRVKKEEPNSMKKRNM